MKGGVNFKTLKRPRALTFEEGTHLPPPPKLSQWETNTLYTVRIPDGLRPCLASAEVGACYRPAAHKTHEFPSRYSHLPWRTLLFGHSYGENSFSISSGAFFVRLGYFELLSIFIPFPFFCNHVGQDPFVTARPRTELGECEPGCNS